MKPKCPYYQPPKYGVTVKDGIEYDFEGSAMCELTDKYCLVEYGEPKDCDTYMEYLTELDNSIKPSSV